MDDLERLVDIGIDAAAWRCSVDPAAASIRDDLRAAACGAAALFALAASPPGAEVFVRFPDGGERSLTSSGWSEAANPILWDRAFFAAMATRSYEALEILAGIPLDLLRKSRTKSEEWRYLYIEAFTAFVRRDRDAPERVLAATKAADPDTVAPAFRTFVLDIASLDLELLYRVMTGDQAGFDAALPKALKGHKHYYGRGDGKRDILGQLALRPLALCAVARDAGMTIGVESDYLPRPVLEGR
ncbi:immunity 49 family protein [Sorangium sp. So ce861]|uniref:immunity 49 family protein n=1 Tax=Sorangium sp. So ce861 TaxID=3133323 RepID=UPI003F6308D7